MSKFMEALGDTAHHDLRLTIKSKLDEESYADFERAMNDASITAPTITNALKKLGIEVSENTIRRWRKK